MQKFSHIIICNVVIIILFILIWGFLFSKHNTVCCYHKQLEIKALVRQIARWAVASQQDKSPMISMLHANYSAGYLQALELIATENEINKVTNLQELRIKVYNTQDKAARNVVASCPNYLGKDVEKELVMVGINVKNDFTPN